jgi:hypothetical protein
MDGGRWGSGIQCQLIHFHDPCWLARQGNANGRLLGRVAESRVLPPFSSTCPCEFFLRVLIRCLFFRSFSCRLRYMVHDDDGLCVLLSASERGIIILSSKLYDAYVFAREV